MNPKYMHHKILLYICLFVNFCNGYRIGINMSTKDYPNQVSILQKNKIPIYNAALLTCASTVLSSNKVFAATSIVNRSSTKLNTFDSFTIKKPNINGAKTLIDGKVSSYDGDITTVTSPIIDPKTNERTIIGKIAQMNKNDVLRVIESSENAWNHGQGKWPQMCGLERIKAIENVIDGLRDKRQEIVNVLMWEICKSRKDAESEFDRTLEFMEATIQAYKQSITSTTTKNSWSSINGIYAIVRRAAIGIMLCLGPYNYPFNETYATLIPALLMGNVAILKLPTIGGLAHILTMDIYAKHLPPGVINFVSGSGRVTVSPMMKTGKIDILAFIGGSKAADSIIKDHPNPHRLTTYLGLEAKNVGILLSDADIENAVKECITGTLSYNGQRCTALKLLMVHSSIVKTFLEKYTVAVSQLKVGLPWDSDVNITPLPEGQKKIEYLTSLVSDAKDKGAQIINKRYGGGNILTHSIMIPPILYPVDMSMKVYQEEQFGPVVPITSFTKLSEITDYFATTAYGQQVSLFTKNTESASNLIDLLSTSVGRININTQCGRSPDILPFSGRKSSALGTMSVTEGLLAFSIPTVIAGKNNEVNQEIMNKAGNKSKFLSISSSSSLSSE